MNDIYSGNCSPGKLIPTPPIEPEDKIWVPDNIEFYKCISVPNYGIQLKMSEIQMLFWHKEQKCYCITYESPTGMDKRLKPHMIECKGSDLKTGDWLTAWGATKEPDLYGLFLGNLTSVFPLEQYGVMCVVIEQLEENGHYHKLIFE